MLNQLYKMKVEGYRQKENKNTIEKVLVIDRNFSMSHISISLQ